MISPIILDEGVENTHPCKRVPVIGVRAAAAHTIGSEILLRISQDFAKNIEWRLTGR